MYCAAVIGLGWMGLLCEFAVACGAKGIVIEKPMAHTLAEVDRMVGACAEAKALLKEGAIGPLSSAVRCWRR